MNKGRKNKKALILLIVLCLFSFFVVKATKKMERDLEPKKEITSEVLECSTCGESSSLEENLEEDLTENILLVDEADTIDITDMVLGTDSGGSISCRKLFSQSLKSSKYVCSTDNAGNVEFYVGELEGGADVTVNNYAFTINKITYPLAFGLGQYRYIDSNKQIRKKSPDYRSNGQQIDTAYVSKTLAPNEVEDFEENISGTVREPFQVEAKVYLKSAADKIDNSQNGRMYQIENKEGDPECMFKDKTCSTEPKFAVSDYNVGKSNRIAYYAGYYGGQIPGGDEELNIVDEDIVTEQECLVEGENFKNIERGKKVVCNRSLPSRLLATFTEFFSAGEVEVCKRDNWGFCQKAKKVAIKMTPIFGEPDKCEKELCANAFLSQTYTQTLSPEESNQLVGFGGSKNEALMFFVATECSLLVGGKEKVDVYCLWDASPTLLNYNLQAKDKSPNQEDFPWNFNRYWAGVSGAINWSDENGYKILN